ncbi:MAG: gliding motility-associated C-terminal domain-containing protein [Chitinophagaceae bacterium]|nr:gliding motility-associated C-terminal domain-containing protein [Chitinophagaceae bacterium]
MLKFVKIKYLLLCIAFCLGAVSAMATHIVGGGITYKCLGTDPFGNVLYEIQVEIYQDCLNGLDVARREDNPAIIGIFSNDGNISIVDSIGRGAGGDTSANIVKPNFDNDCVNNPPEVCLRRLSFTRVFRLPSNSSGYKVVYTRCCRNESILNLNNPGQVGATYFCQIPGSGEVLCNNSAYFWNYPPQIICINTPLTYDHSAIDPDGDSLSYELCDAYPGGETRDPKPRPNPILPPPLSVLNSNPPSFGYKAGFSAQVPMGGNPTIQIDSRTGMLTGTPNLQGRFVVSVCVHEWRNGVIINTVRREFQFVVTNCSKVVVASIPQFSEEYNTYIVECKTKTVKFVNTSKGGFQYDWDFGVSGAVSNDFEPTYTYPDTGTYVVRLVVNKGSTCEDSISRFVKVYPDFSSSFVFDGLRCPKAEIAFTDLSEATYKPINRWLWNFGDGSTSTEQNPKHRYQQGGIYNVQLISKSEKGCVDTARTSIDVERFFPFAGNDTIIVRGESVDFNAQGGIYYEWTPADRLNTTGVYNPRGFYPDTGKYNYSVFIRSSYGCEGTDSIQVWVVAQGSLFVPSAFSPNGDGLNDVLKPLSVGFREYKYFRVFNRWGEQVFQTNRIGDGWDGTFYGKTSDIGTYYWMLDAIDKDGNTVKQKGDVTLVR